MLHFKAFKLFDNLNIKEIQALQHANLYENIVLGFGKDHK